MNPRLVRILVLAAGVAALAAAYFARPGKEPAQAQALSALPRSDATRIRIERPGQPAIVLVKASGAWRVAEPLAARADAHRVERLLDLLDVRAQDRFPATDLARFDLDRPGARVTINDASFAFGALNTLTREQYLQAGSHVYLVKLAVAAALPPDISHVIGKQLFAPDEEPVAFEGDGFRLALEGGRWVLAPPAVDASQDDFVRWTADWRGASATLAQPHAGDVPKARIGISLKDRRRIVVGILAREPELVLVREDEKLQYHFPPAARTLVERPGEPRRADPGR